MIPQATFDELWDRSALFRNFFIGSKGYFSDGNLKWDIAKSFWDNRFPKIKWCFCQDNNCSAIISCRDEMCFKHSEQMPLWKFYKQDLWKRKYIYRQKAQYVNYLKELAKKKYGEVPLGYRILKIDGNPFNLHPKNICLLSKMTVFLVKHGLLPVKMAIEFDNEIYSFMKRRFNDGYMRIRQSVITYDDVAISAGVDKRSVMNSVSKGVLDFENLDSIIDFVIKKKTDREK